MQKFYNKNQVFPLYFLVFVTQNILEMNDTQRQKVCLEEFLNVAVSSLYLTRETCENNRLIKLPCNMEKMKYINPELKFQLKFFIVYISYIPKSL